MEKYLVDLFVASARRQSPRVPGWVVRLYLSIFSPPLGKTIRLDMARDMLKGYEIKGKRVLDVGCGIGDLSFMLAERGATIVGIELDAQKVAAANDIARRWRFDSLRFIAGDVTKLEQMGLGQFDAVFCLALLEHVQDDVALLQQMASALRPGGIFIMEVPSALRKTIPEVEAEDGHMRPGYLLDEVPDLLENAGFRIVKQQTKDPLGLFYHWCKLSRLVRGSSARGRLFALLAPIFIPLIRLTSVLIKRPGTELCFLAVKQEKVQQPHQLGKAKILASVEPGIQERLIDPALH